MNSLKYDALLLVSFGGPEGLEDVMPFLRNVTAGRNVPVERLEEVARHYELFGGVSPINEQNRALISDLQREFAEHEIDLPIYWGNRNWHPLLADTVRQMKDAGVRRALAFGTSAYSSYSGCRQYIEDIARACTQVGPESPQIDKLPPFFNHPGFLEACEERLRQALTRIPIERRDDVTVVFTAHSIPTAMAAGCDYEQQLQFVADRLAQQLRLKHFSMAYQSRSGPVSQPWLEPDVCDWIKSSAASGVKDLVIDPIGFVSDHMEVIYDIDTEAKNLCDELNVNLVRAKTVGTHPAFVRMIRQLVRDRLVACCQEDPGLVAEAGFCPATCCPSGRPQSANSGEASARPKGVRHE